jgi:hypothetical protein
VGASCVVGSGAVLRALSMSIGICVDEAGWSPEMNGMVDWMRDLGAGRLRDGHVYPIDS